MNTRARGSFGGFRIVRSLAILCLLAAPLPAWAREIVLEYDRGSAPAAFAAEEIRRAAASLPPTTLLPTIRLESASQPRGGANAEVEFVDHQAYSISREGGTITIRGTGPSGVMYGGLDAAETLRLKTIDDLGAAKATDHKPYIARRGIKFNIPLDLRTPSYSDPSDAFQANIPDVWDITFWQAQLDAMARNRYNVLTLWSLHPFPSMVKVPEYPDVALDDVWRTKVKLDSSFSTTGTNFVRPAMLADHEVVKKITIDQKIDHWRTVMQMAKDRGIEVYVFTWTIFTYGTDGQYGITSAQNNPTTIDYFRKSVREMVLTYPLLAGIGITAGENMQERSDQFGKEPWLWATYGEGVRDALKQQGDRKFRLIHRFHQTGLSAVQDAFKDYPGTFEFSLKYSIAHMYSVPNPTFINEALPFLGPKLKTWLTVRNDDIYDFRWGDPTFARDYVKAMPASEKLAGFYMGPDGYCWGRDYLSTEPVAAGASRPLVMDRQWLSFMLWGRLAYDPELPDSLFQRTLGVRHPSVPSDRLMAASVASSRIIPQTTRFFWGDIDLKWYPEASLSHPSRGGYYTIRHFVENDTMPNAGVLNVRQWRYRLLNRQPMEGQTPPQVADALSGYSAQTMKVLAEIRAVAAAGDRELILTLGDFQAMAHLGDYYAEKIRAACDLALYDRSGDAAQRDSAVKHLETALAHWKSYAAVATAQYRPALFNRVGYVDRNELTAKVAADIDLAKNWMTGTVPSDGTSGRTERPFNQ